MKNEYSFPLVIIAIVLGVTLYKQFSFDTLTFEQPAMAVIYGLTFAMTMYFLFKRKKQKED